jgi:hypothetical protein
MISAPAAARKGSAGRNCTGSIHRASGHSVPRTDNCLTRPFGGCCATLVTPRGSPAIFPFSGVVDPDRKAIPDQPGPARYDDGCSTESTCGAPAGSRAGQGTCRTVTVVGTARCRSGSAHIAAYAGAGSRTGRPGTGPARRRAPTRCPPRSRSSAGTASRGPAAARAASGRSRRRRTARSSSRSAPARLAWSVYRLARAAVLGAADLAPVRSLRAAARDGEERQDERARDPTRGACARGAGCTAHMIIVRF